MRRGALRSGLRLLLSTIPVLLLLLGGVIHASGEMVHSRLLAIGQASWEDYRLLRTDPEEPTCDPDKEFVPAAPAGEDEDETGAAPDSDDALVDDLLADEPAEEEPPSDDELVDDLLADEPEPEPEEAPESDDALVDDLLADEPAESDDALVDDLLADDEDEHDPAKAAQLAWEAARDRCRRKWDRYNDTIARIDGDVRAFRAFEKSVASIVHFGVAHLTHILVLLFLVCAATATAIRGHIGLRPIRTVTDDRVSQGSQLVANVLMVLSARDLLEVYETAGAGAVHNELLVWLQVGFGVMAALNVWHLLRPAPDLTRGGGLGAALLTVPLYATMALISGFYFLLAEGHPAGLAIYLTKLFEHALLYIHVGLFVWIGMLLKGTRLAELFFDVLRPWRLPPELLAFVVVVAAAVPTAYSGASGIFVIAAGAVIFHELRRAGARRQLALAATAMSGSMGVVLSPCLLVVIVASLNGEVTTDQLYGWGTRIFGLTAVLFLVAALTVRKNPLKVAPASEAGPATLRAFAPLAPYFLIGGALVALYAFALETPIDEHSAPGVLPVILLFLLLYDRLAARRAAKKAPAPEAGADASDRSPGFLRATVDATQETSGHIGALLSLMGLSVCLGGIIERSDVMAAVPETFGSVYLAMGLLLVVLVIVGMTMDPYGAVILVSATLATVAYRNGIDPVHFWMVVLVAFELGYLTPPVALNHLLTRQVVGEDAAFRHIGEGSFWSRHERILLPIVVMATALLLVAYVPLLW
ncbi:MAG: TRAP transporter large permease subunit [Myxococcota bacterium]